MKTFEIKTTDTFYLGDKKYEYEANSYDKKYFLENIVNINLKDKKYKQKLKEIFYNILKRQNKDVVILDNDLLGLFKYFLSKYL